MCTVSWLHEDDGFTLLFNRDESRLRAPGEPPHEEATEAGTRYLSPRDPDAGGTWIVVNEHGMVSCLLNRYPANGRPQASRPGASRGFIVRLLADASCAEDAMARLATIDLVRYQPFTLLTLDAGGDVRRAAWDGVDLVHTVQPTMPLASSGEAPEAVQALRRSVWAAMTGDQRDQLRDAPTRLRAFHSSHAPEKGPMSPCMHRAEARTVSLIQVQVTRHAVAMAYAPGPPCRTSLTAPVVLDRVARRALA